MLLRICCRLLATPDVQLWSRLDVDDHRAMARQSSPLCLLHQLLLDMVQPVQLVYLIDESGEKLR